MTVHGDFVGCHPRWSIGHEGAAANCPYGQAALIPFATLSIPKDSSFFEVIGVIYSATPFFAVLLNTILIVVRRRTMETGWLLYTTFSGVLALGIKAIIRQPRPRSCLLSCGMPSGHSVFAVGVWLVLLWDLVVQVPDITFNSRCCRLALLSLMMLPVPWARVEIGDHSLSQVLAGSSLGIFTAITWIFFIWPQLEKQIERYMPVRYSQSRTSPVRQCDLSATSSGVELAEL